jgi:hypothetical protein
VGNVLAMPSFMKKLTDLANSPQGRKLADKAKQFADDPKTKEKVDQAKRKLAEMRSGGSTGGTTGSSQGPPPPDGPKAA